MNKQLGWNICLSCFRSLNLSVLIILLRKIGSTKNHENFMRMTRLKHLSYAAGITFLSDLGREI